MGGRWVEDGCHRSQIIEDEKSGLGHNFPELLLLILTFTTSEFWWPLIPRAPAAPHNDIPTRRHLHRSPFSCAAPCRSTPRRPASAGASAAPASRSLPPPRARTSGTGTIASVPAVESEAQNTAALRLGVTADEPDPAKARHGPRPAPEPSLASTPVLCVPCGQNEFEASRCNSPQGHACSRCTECGRDQYEAVACSGATDRVCRELSTACRTGPYVWDRGTDPRTEGIGIRMLASWHKHALMLADAVGAPWIAAVVNGHDGGANVSMPMRGDDTVLGYFGLGASDCNHAALLGLKGSNTRRLKFRDAEELYSPHPDLACTNDGAFPCKPEAVCACPRWPSLCSGNYTPPQRRAQLGIGESTVIEVHESFTKPLNDGRAWNYCTFNARFRSQYYGAQQGQARRARPPSEYWIAVHFRWGDAAQTDPDKPNYRTGSGVTELGDGAQPAIRGLASSFCPRCPRKRTTPDAHRGRSPVCTPRVDRSDSRVPKRRAARATTARRFRSSARRSQTPSRCLTATGKMHCGPWRKATCLLEDRPPFSPLVLTSAATVRLWSTTRRCQTMRRKEPRCASWRTARSTWPRGITPCYIATRHAGGCSHNRPCLSPPLPPVRDCAGLCRMRILFIL